MKKSNEVLNCFSWIFILFFFIVIVCNLKYSNNISEIVFWTIWLIMSVILLLLTNDTKTTKDNKKNKVVYIIPIFIIISVIRIKNNQIILLLYIIQFYQVLHFLEKILEKKESKNIYIEYFFKPLFMNFFRFFIIWLIFFILNKNKEKYELFSPKYSWLYSLVPIILDSVFIGLYNLYNEKEQIDNKISFIKLFKYYNWIFFIIYSTFIFLTYSNIVSQIIIGITVFLYIVLKIHFLKIDKRK